jgi:hypothetical protein
MEMIWIVLLLLLILENRTSNKEGKRAVRFNAKREYCSTENFHVE